MKKTFKKLGIVAIIVGILSPFVSLPKVNAATDGCDYYLNQYFFLDETGGGFWDQYENGGYTTSTMFPYTFVSLAEGQEMIIENVDVFDIYTPQEVISAQNKFKAVLAADDTIVEKAELYGTVDNSKASSYEEVTHVLHGYWNREGDISLDTAGHLDDKNNLEANDNLFKEYTIQSILNQNNIQSSSIGVTFSEGILKNNTIQTYGEYEGSKIKNYFQFLVDSVNSDDNSVVKNGYINTNYTFKGIENNEKYFNISITRSLDTDTALNSDDIYFGECDASGNCSVYTEGNGVTEVAEIENSYKAWQAWNADSSTNKENWYKTHSFVPVEKSEIDFDLSKKYYWPTILNVEYKVCDTASTPAQWTLTYDDNVDDNTVTNMPNPVSVSEKVGTSIKVSSITPKRDGYTFQKWCTESNGSGNCYKAGDEVKNTTATKLTLFAQWGKEGTEDNKGTGVISYVIGFAAVGLVATGIYLVSKKKNLFKQI